MLDLHAACDTATEAAHAAADLMRASAGHPDDVRAKGENDLVTDTDEAAQAAILDVLHGAFPDVDVLAEEDVEDEDAIEPTIDGYRWIVDPIDGTTNFLHDVPPYAVSIALQRGDAVVVGVVMDVARGEVFSAVAGQGLEVDGTPRTVRATETLSEALLATGFPYRRYEHLDDFLALVRALIPDVRDLRRHGSASIDLAWTACGRFSGFFETGLRPWDVAAGVLMVREAGGRVTDYRGQGGLAPIFGRQVCATGGPIHDALLARVAAMKDTRL